MATTGNIKGFMLIYSGQALSLLGSAIVKFSVIWWLTQLTGSPQVLATASLMAYLPDLLVGPFGGVMVDRLSRKRIMIISDAFTALATGVMAVLYLRGNVGVVLVYGLLLARGLGSAFHWPAMQASISLMVPKNQLQRVSGMQQGVNGVINIVGPPVGAFLIALLPLELILMIDVGTALVAILPLVVTDVPNPVSDGKQITVSTVIRDMREGFAYLVGWRSLLLFAFMIMLVHVVAIPAISFIPLMVTEFFSGGATEFALMESVFGLGLIVGGVTLSGWGGFSRKTTTILSALVLCGLGLLVVWVASSGLFSVSLFGVFLFAFSVSIVAASIGALQKSVVPAGIQGRVFTLIRSGTNAMPSLGLAVAGPITQIIGLRSWYLLGGLVFVVVGVISGLISDVRNIEDTLAED